MRVKAFFVVLNGTLTLLVFVFVVGVILFFSRSLLQIIEANDVATRITTGGYLCYAVFYLCLAAEGHAKVVNQVINYCLPAKNSEPSSSFNRFSSNCLGTSFFSTEMTSDIRIRHQKF